MSNSKDIQTFPFFGEFLNFKICDIILSITVHYKLHFELFF